MSGKIASLVALSLAAVAIAGCSLSEDPAVVAQRKKLLLADEPAGAVSIAEAKKNVQDQSAKEPSEVVLVGRIGAGDAEPWNQGKTAFMISEAPDPSHSHASAKDAENCPFCKRRAANAPLAIVEFLGDDGNVLPIDARELLRVEKNQVVVVRGSGRINDLDQLVVSAQGIHVKPQAQ